MGAMAVPVVTVSDASHIVNVQINQKSDVAHQ